MAFPSGNDGSGSRWKVPVRVRRDMETVDLDPEVVVVISDEDITVTPAAADVPTPAPAPAVPTVVDLDPFEIQSIPDWYPDDTRFPPDYYYERVYLPVTRFMESLRQNPGRRCTISSVANVRLDPPPQVSSAHSSSVSYVSATSSNTQPTVRVSSATTGVGASFGALEFGSVETTSLPSDNDGYVPSDDAADIPLPPRKKRKVQRRSGPPYRTPRMTVHGRKLVAPVSSDTETEESTE